MKELTKVGQRYKDYELTKFLPINELQSNLRELVHLPSGAHVLHLENEDPENVFCLSLKTHPSDSKGVAHILEHTVLCGSKNFPVKDPFFAMSRRSLNTYMNALTGSDFTCYPAASQVPKDFYNLLEVFIDAVFRPHLNEMSFLQEGHRLEFLVPDDPKTPLIYKGIVYNEMKGSMASSDSRLWKKMMHELFPTLTYGFNSGGDPEEIPDLTYQELLDFHSNYYHPSRCLFYFYGNLPLEGHLDFLEKHLLNDVKKIPDLPKTPSEKRLLAPVKKIDSYPHADEDGETTDKILYALGFLTCTVQEAKEWLALQVLDLILMGTDAGPLKRALLTSKLCKQADAYIDCDISEVPFIFICKGCTRESAEKLTDFILNSLKQIVKEGIPKSAIEAAIHQIELARSEITGSHSPFGLSLFMRSALLKQHGVEPEEGLKVHSLFDTLRASCDDPNYLGSLIQKYLINNPHRAELIMLPDPKLALKEHEIEEKKLESIKQKLSEKEILDIVAKTKQLADFQGKLENQDLEVLPKVTLDDVNKQARDIPLFEDNYQGLTIFRHPCFTNQITYADIHFDLPELKEDELVYLRLFSSFISEVGCGGRNYKENLEYIQGNTGGVGAFFSLHVQANDFNTFRPTFGIRGKALYRKNDKLFALFNDILTSLDFTDQDRLHELIHQHHSSLEHNLTHSALKYALNMAASSLSLPSTISNHLYGLNYLWSIRKIAKDFDANPQALINKFEELKTRLLGLKNARLVLSIDQSEYEHLKKEGFYGLAASCKTNYTPWQPNIPITPVLSQGRVIASPVAFSALTFPIPSYAHPDSAALSVAGHLFENKTLHKRIREQGGAYGSGASSNSLAGHLTFYSYRDPHIVSTTKAFKEAIDSLLAGDFDEREIEEAKLGIIQEFDAPIAPGHRASSSYSWILAGKTLEVRQEHRNRLLAVDKISIQKAVEAHIKAPFEKGILVSFASKQLLEQENALFVSSGKEPLPIYTV